MNLYPHTYNCTSFQQNIIDVAKKAFPDAIQHVAPEQAIKDLGFKVTLVYWDSAIQTEASFGANQALIFSSEEAQEEELFGTMQKWLKEHPFVLSSLESKGLEFDDVGENISRSTSMVHCFPIPALVSNNAIFLCVLNMLPVLGI